MTAISNEQQAYNYCIHLLAKREYSQYELTTKLTRLGVGEEAIADCLSRLAEENYQSDERFAEMFSRTKVNQRHGERKVRYELKQKGISEALIDHYVALHEAEFLDNAIYLLEKKLPFEQREKHQLDKKVKDKIIRFLLGKGYDYQLIQIAFEEVLNSSE